MPVRSNPPYILNIIQGMKSWERVIILPFAKYSAEVIAAKCAFTRNEKLIVNYAQHASEPDRKELFSQLGDS